MTSKMRFGKQIQSGYATGLRELMPHGFTDDSQSELRDHFFADTANRFDIAKEVFRTAFRINEPLSAKVHDDCFVRDSDDKR